MKNALIFCFTMLFMFSCAKDEGIDEITLESYSEHQGQKDHMTLAQLNAELLKYGSEPITQEEIDDVLTRIRAYRVQKGKVEKAYSCSSAYPWGDWSKMATPSSCTYSGSVSLSSLDLVLAQSYIEEYEPNMNDNYAPAGSAYNGYDACASDNFAVISYYELGTGAYDVEQVDKTIVAAYILGQCI